MKKPKSVRIIIIAVLCFTIICLGIGFIFLSLELKKIKGSLNHFDVSFTSVNKTSSIKGSNVEPKGDAKIDSSKKVIQMEVTLNAPRDEVSYTALIKNNGNRDIKIVNVFLTPDYADQTVLSQIAPIIIQTTKVKDKVLEPDEELAYKVIVTYDGGSTVIGKKEVKIKAVLVAEEVE